MKEIGNLIEGEAERDAVHIAIIPVEAGETLKPGQPVVMKDGKAYATEINALGVIDPYLWHVEPGQRAWLFLTPNTVTALRHEWSHPQFPRHTRPVTIEERRKAERWLRDFAREYQIKSADLLAQAVAGQYITFGTDYPDADRPPVPEFWDMLEIVTGAQFSQAHREGTTFSCSC